MFMTKSTLSALSRDYPHAQFQRAFATSQSLSGPSSRVILLSDGQHLILLFLNFLQTKVIAKKSYLLSECHHYQIHHLGITLFWSFDVGMAHYRFKLVKKILTLGNWQREFIEKIIL